MMRAITTINLISEKVGYNLHSLVILVSLCFIFPFSSYGQEYGLEFAAKPISKDQRTMLDLNPDGFYFFRGDFELSFQHSDARARAVDIWLYRAHCGC